MFLPGLGYPVRKPDMTDAEWARIRERHEKSERIGTMIALFVAAVGLVCFVAFWVIAMWKGIL